MARRISARRRVCSVRANRAAAVADDDVVENLMAVRRMLMVQVLDADSVKGVLERKVVAKHSLAAAVHVESVAVESAYGGASEGGNVVVYQVPDDPFEAPDPAAPLLEQEFLTKSPLNQRKRRRKRKNPRKKSLTLITKS